LRRPEARLLIVIDEQDALAFQLLGHLRVVLVVDDVFRDIFPFVAARVTPAPTLHPEGGLEAVRLLTTVLKRETHTRLVGELSVGEPGNPVGRRIGVIGFLGSTGVLCGEKDQRRADRSREFEPHGQLLGTRFSRTNEKRPTCLMVAIFNLYL
jgi:hypothetical protein